MAKGSRTGLPTKRKVVSRMSKNGKFSTYTQAYHLNPFKKTTQGTGRKQGQDKGGAPNRADQITTKMQSLPAINKRASMEGTLQSVKPIEPIGPIKTEQIISKIKSTQDVKTLSTNLLQKSLPKMNNIRTVDDGKRVNDHSKIFNNIPNTTDAYNIVISDLVANKGNMSENAFSALLYSLNDHNLVENVLSGQAKKESYDIDELSHDQQVRYSSPVGQVMNYYSADLSDNLKASVINLQQKQNDLEFVNNGVQLTDRERNLGEKWIDFNNDEVNSNISAGLLHNRVMIKLDKNIAAMIYKTSSTITFNLYNSVIYEFNDNIKDLDSGKQTKIKDVDAINDTNFTLHQCAFQLNVSAQEVYLVANISVKNTSDYNFISLSGQYTDNFIDEYNDHLLNSIDTSQFSKIEIRNKIDELTANFQEMKNDNSFLIIER